MEHRDEFEDLYADNPKAMEMDLACTEWLLTWADSTKIADLAHGAFMACIPCMPSYYLYALVDEAFDTSLDRGFF